MKKIAIVTLYHNNNNYGGLAQAYALCEYLNSKGYDAEILDYEKQKGLSGSFKDRLELHANGKGAVRFYQMVKYVFKWLYNKEIVARRNRNALEKYSEGLNERKEKFAEFRNTIPHSKIYCAETISESADKYDAFVSGSDQIWKPGVIQDAFVLKFVADRKKISYASSVAIAGIKSREWFCKYLKDNLMSYSAISVREESTSIELCEILGHEVSWVVDPTMLLGKEKWNDITAKRIIKENYIFAYFLGGSAVQRNFVTRYALEHDLKIVSLPFAGGDYIKEDVNFGDYRLFKIGLPEFFSLIKYAEVIFTDSFHAVCFSRVFSKEFFVMEREVSHKTDRMTTRIESILDIMNLRDHLINEHSVIDKIEPIDYCLVEEHLQPYIERSQKYLIEALND